MKLLYFIVLLAVVSTTVLGSSFGISEVEAYEGKFRMYGTSGEIIKGGTFIVESRVFGETRGVIDPNDIMNTLGYTITTYPIQNEPVIATITESNNVIEIIELNVLDKVHDDSPKQNNPYWKVENLVIDTSPSKYESGKKYDIELKYDDKIENIWFKTIEPTPQIMEEIPQSSSLLQTKEIPAWVKSIFVFYAEDNLTDAELIEALQFLIKDGIIVIS